MQHFDGELRQLDKLSMANIQEYAELVGAEYQLIRGKPFRKHLTSPCQKVHMINQEFDEYDQVLMLDIDMFTPKDMKTNIFDQKGVGLYNTVQKRLHQRLSHSHPFISSMNIPYWGGAIYKMDKNLRKTLRSCLGENEQWMENYIQKDPTNNKLYRYEDEGIFHTLAFYAGLKIKHPNLDNKWCQCSFLPNPEKAGFIHIRTKITPSGPEREKIENYNELVSKGII